MNCIQRTQWCNSQYVTICQEGCHMIFTFNCRTGSRDALHPPPKHKSGASSVTHRLLCHRWVLYGTVLYDQRNWRIVGEKSRSGLYWTHNCNKKTSIQGNTSSIPSGYTETIDRHNISLYHKHWWMRISLIFIVLILPLLGIVAEIYCKCAPARGTLWWCFQLKRNLILNTNYISFLDTSQFGLSANHT